MGALTGVTIVEFGGLGPGPFAGMLLSDMGANVIRIDRPDPIRSTMRQERSLEPMLRNRRSITLNLKQDHGLGIALRLIEHADVVIEGFRPGVAEKLGIGPANCQEVNPRVIYGRMTGWGQDGVLANSAGHDINYIGLSGALHGVGERGRPPVPPMILAGDTGGGGLFLALGVCAALVERASSGQGQVIDAAILDGAATLMSPIYGSLAAGVWVDERGSNRLDGAAPFYRTYQCADGKYVAVGAIEPQFFAALLAGLELNPAMFEGRDDPANWGRHAALLADAFRARTRDTWCALFSGTDACVTPVLSMTEAPTNAHNSSRELFSTMGAIDVPTPAPRFARTPSAISRVPVEPGTDTREILSEMGYTQTEIEALLASGAAAVSD